jgi:hypothetical protein
MERKTFGRVKSVEDAEGASHGLTQAGAVGRPGATFLLIASTSTAGPRKLHGNNFFSNCRFSHTEPDDPIVFPGQPGRSHPHTFFGNTTANAFSILGSLRAGATTCKPKADKAAYWIPTLFRDGHAIRPAKAQVYYRGYEQMHAFPSGLRLERERPLRPSPTSFLYDQRERRSTPRVDEKPGRGAGCPGRRRAPLDAPRRPRCRASSFLA